jgi:hypothetical protein
MRNRVLIPRSLAEWTTRSDPATGLAAGKVLEGRAPGDWGLSTQHLNQVLLLVGFDIVGAAVVFGVVVARGLALVTAGLVVLRLLARSR